jgi:hypothetical protein
VLNLLDPDADIDTHSYCYGDCNSYCYCYCNSYCHCYCYSYGYANVDAYGYSYCDHDTYTPAYSVTKGYRATKASADSPAETVSLACDGRA